MNSGHKFLMLILFGAAAWYRVLLGAPLPKGDTLSIDRIVLPSAPPGWRLLEEKPAAGDSSAPGKTAIYQASDGSKLTLYLRIAWAERRKMPVSFYPDDCSFLGAGWNFRVRGADDNLAPGIYGHRIEVERDKERLVLLSCYSCRGNVIGTWQDFKMQLIWQRVRRERNLWVKTLVVCAPNTEARKRAADLLLAASRGVVSRGLETNRSSRR